MAKCALKICHSDTTPEYDSELLFNEGRPVHTWPQTGRHMRFKDLPSSDLGARVGHGALQDSLEPPKLPFISFIKS